MTDVEGVRWALGGLSGSGGPVSVRRANFWISRMVEVGLLDRARPTFRDGSIVWATHLAVGKVAPNLFRQTTRHEVAVALVSAHYLAAGYTWERDRKPAMRLDHQADGVARKGDRVELVEVELTSKTSDRYRVIFHNALHRFENEGVAQITYFCTPDVARTIEREADARVFRTERHRVVAHDVFDVKGRWVGADEGLPELPATAVPSATLPLDF
ncbi:hypothetical protein [Subtercola sp. RTI3]|uniref:hypothetical protein n=1 Tax=Subtercola sp. RTI3 TaxID=3048639 RepID=UPI002B22CD1E|nr:hypothetical protein [Subtercola sp. RTI3]MEA9986096.1 hypothetical protein [Subtercola sp. RTI3]